MAARRGSEGRRTRHLHGVGSCPHHVKRDPAPSTTLRRGGTNAAADPPPFTGTAEGGGGGAAISNVDRIHLRSGAFAKRAVADQWHNSRREDSSHRICSHILSLPHNSSIALAGTGSGPGIGRAAVTSPRGFGSHGPEGVRRAGVPAAGANAWTAGLRSIRACDHETSVCNPRGSMETACDRPTGRQTPDGRAWECLFLSYEFVRRFPARPSSRLLNGQTRERAWR
jgi:hypothetical protein